MKKNYLIAGFKGDDNSAKLLLDSLSGKLDNIIYLDNDFFESEEEISSYLHDHNGIKYIFEIGQKPRIKKIYIELVGNRNRKKLMTKFNYKGLSRYFQSNGFKVSLSNNAGNYLCNNIYYFSLDYIKKQNLKAEVVFIHIPTINNIKNINKLSKIILEYIKNKKTILSV